MNQRLINWEQKYLPKEDSEKKSSFSENGNKLRDQKGPTCWPRPRGRGWRRSWWASWCWFWSGTEPPAAPGHSSRQSAAPPGYNSYNLGPKVCIRIDKSLVDQKLDPKTWQKSVIWDPDPDWESGSGSRQTKKGKNYEVSCLKSYIEGLNLLLNVPFSCLG